MNDLYTELKEYINKIPFNKNILDKTKTEYIKEYTRMYINNKTPEEQAARKSTYYKYRASWLYANTLLANIKIDEIEGEKDNKVKDCLINALDEIVDRIKRYDISISFKKDELQKRLSKKGQIVTLKKTWSTLMFEYMRSVDSKYLDAVCVMFISGCRPAELESGVQVINCAEGLTMIIKGKKMHDGDKYGQERREYTVSITDPHYFHLKQKIDDELLIKIDNAKLFGEQIRSFSKKILDEKTYVSPYTYRHNFSRMLKNLALSHDEIACLLGHCNDKSQNWYSRASGKDNNDFKISNIKATKKIKHVVNNSYIRTTAPTAPRM